ncbi:PD-(D/E)XK nuclease family protein [Qipengyuania sp. SM2507]
MKKSASESLRQGVEAFGTEWQFLNKKAPRSERLRATVEQLRPLLLSTRSRASSPYKIEPLKLESIAAELREGIVSSRALRPGFNPWSLAGLRRDEVKTCACLAAFLSPRQSGEIAKALLQQILKQAIPPINDLFDRGEPYRVYTERYFPGDRSTRMDIVIESHRQLLTIEVKIDASEGKAKKIPLNSIEPPAIDASQFSRVVARTQALAKERRKDDWAVLILAKSKIEHVPRTSAVQWREVANVMSRIARVGKAGPSLTAVLLAEFGMHLRSI